MTIEIETCAGFVSGAASWTNIFGARHVLPVRVSCQRWCQVIVATRYNFYLFLQYTYELLLSFLKKSSAKIYKINDKYSTILV